jgi:hypothetical protein
MSFEISKEIVQQVLVLGKIVDSLFLLVKKTDDETLRQDLMRHVEQLVQHGNALVLEIERRYPDLNPDV